MARFKTPSVEMVKLLCDSGSTNYATASAALHELAVALTLPLKQGVMKGDIIGGIFEPIKFQPGAAIEFPLDFLSPGSEKDYVAYTIPNQGRIPERHVEGDFVMVPVYDVGCSIDWNLKYARDARWDIIGRAMQVLESSFVRKNNNDGWHTLLAAGVGRGLVIYDDAGTAGLFTKRLVALMKTSMRRYGGGNSTSINRGKLTDLYMSPEALEDIRSWDLSQVDDTTRRQIFIGGGDTEAALSNIFGVNLHDIDELGVGQEYQAYYTSTLGGSLPGSKVETVIGLDLSKNDSFVNPIRQEIEIFEDPTFHRQRRASMYGWGEHGFSVLDSRRILLGAL
ncbi:MAG: hypothetical protein K2R98_19475 [Gemmataceae bacterium]|nr:hypothetical protein [Gemmataceae bacterium]